MVTVNQYCLIFFFSQKAKTLACIRYYFTVFLQRFTVSSYNCRVVVNFLCIVQFASLRMTSIKLKDGFQLECFHIIDMKISKENLFILMGCKGEGKESIRTELKKFTLLGEVIETILSVDGFPSLTGFAIDEKDETFICDKENILKKSEDGIWNSFFETKSGLISAISVDETGVYFAIDKCKNDTSIIQYLSFNNAKDDNWEITRLGKVLCMTVGSKNLYATLQYCIDENILIMDKNDKSVLTEVSLAQHTNPIGLCILPGNEFAVACFKQWKILLFKSCFKAKGALRTKGRPSFVCCYQNLDSHNNVLYIATVTGGPSECSDARWQIEMKNL